MKGVHTLLEIGGSIDIRDSAQRTLLHRACEEVITFPSFQTHLRMMSAQGGARFYSY